MIDHTQADEELYRNYLIHGTKEALQLLFNRYSESLIAFLRGIVKSPEDAEDLMIETFAQLLSRNQHFRGSSSFKTWLFAIGRNQALKYINKNFNKIRYNNSSIEEIRIAEMDNDDGYFSEDLTELSSSPESFIIDKDKSLQIKHAIQKLPVDYYQVLMLIYYEDFSYEQTAHIMHKSVKQITNLAYFARQMLKKQLAQTDLL